VLGTPITPPFREGTEQAIFGMGCFWGADGFLGFDSPRADE
jgi:peptide-methionine (S)-S-oxide reductase